MASFHGHKLVPGRGRGRWVGGESQNLRISEICQVSSENAYSPHPAHRPPPPAVCGQLRCQTATATAGHQAEECLSARYHRGEFEGCSLGFVCLLSGSMSSAPPCARNSQPTIRACACP